MPDELASIPASNFRKAYSNLIKAIWVNPDIKDRVKSDPSKLREFGFQKVPSKVEFKDASGDPSQDGYEKQMEEWRKNGEGGSVTFHVPPKPQAEDTATMTAADSCCCSCCPCCCCT